MQTNPTVSQPKVVTSKEIEINALAIKLMNSAQQFQAAGMFLSKINLINIVLPIIITAETFVSNTLCIFPSLNIIVEMSSMYTFALQM